MSHVSFILLAEFHVNEGSILPYQYPFPTGTDDQLLAELMIPDGAHANAEDWTYFFLNQAPANTIAPVFSDAQSTDSGSANSHDHQPLLYVINLVKTKKDAAAPRGGWVKALAICTRHPFINIFRSALIKTLDEFFLNPSVDILAGLYDAINAMDLSRLPNFTRNEKFILRATDRRDLFAEKFAAGSSSSTHTHRTVGAQDSMDGNAIYGHNGVPGGATTNGSTPHAGIQDNDPFSRDRSGSDLHGSDRPISPRSERSESASSGSLVEAIPWRDSAGGGPDGGGGDDTGSTTRGTAKVGQDTEDDGFTLVDASISGPPGARAPSRAGNASSSNHPQPPVQPQPSSAKAFDQQSRSSKATRSTRHRRHGSTNTMGAPSSSSDPDFHALPSSNSSGGGSKVHLPGELDTHYFPTSLVWNKADENTGVESVVAKIDVMVPTSSFPEEVGDYSLTRLVHLFCLPSASVSGPQHPHLHSSGPLTHPLIVLFNALITQKRIIFLGHGRPAHHVARYVLAACAFGSGCGAVLKGFTNRAFPYTNLTNHSLMTSVPGFIAGVTNPIYETTPGWDILCNIETGKITVNKDIQSPTANASLFPQPPSLPRTGSNANVGAGAAGGEEDASATGGPGAKGANGAPNAKPDFIGGGRSASDTSDALFIEDLQQYQQAGQGGLNELQIRARVMEYVQRFVQLAGKWEEENFGGTAVGYPSVGFSEGQGVLGSGVIVEDGREMAVSLGRIDGWRRSTSYELCKTDFQAHVDDSAIRGVDLGYQISRLRFARFLSEAEVHLILDFLASNVHTYEQVVELLAHLPFQLGGLLPIAFGLFHPLPSVRDNTVALFSTIRSYKIGVHYLRHLNHFHRMAYVRLALNREAVLSLSPTTANANANSNSNGHSRIALGMGPGVSTIPRSSSNLSTLSANAI